MAIARSRSALIGRANTVVTQVPYRREDPAHFDRSFEPDGSPVGPGEP